MPCYPFCTLESVIDRYYAVGGSNSHISKTTRIYLLYGRQINNLPAIVCVYMYAGRVVYLK